MNPKKPVPLITVPNCPARHVAVGADKGGLTGAGARAEGRSEPLPLGRAALPSAVTDGGGAGWAMEALPRAEPEGAFDLALQKGNARKTS